MTEIEGAFEGSRLIDQNSDCAVSKKLADTLLLASLTQKHRGAKHSPFPNSGTPYLKNFLHQKHKCEKMLLYTFAKMQMCCCMFVNWIIKFDVLKNSCNYYYYY